MEGGAAVETAPSLVAGVLCVPAKVCPIGRSLALSTAAAVVKNYPPLFLPCLSFSYFFTLITVWESLVSTTRASLCDFKDTALRSILQLHVKLVNYFLLLGAQGS